MQICATKSRFSRFTKKVKVCFPALLLFVLILLAGSMLLAEEKNGSGIELAANQNTPPEKQTPAPTPVPKKEELDLALEIDGVQKEVTALKTLNEGALPEVFSIRRLFETNLEVEEEILTRIKALQESIKIIEEDIRKQEKEKTEQGIWALRFRLLGLRLEKDQLRLAFLKQPRAAREKLIQQDRDRHLAALSIQIAQLDKEVQALLFLVNEKLPEDFDIRKLFEVDLTDEAAIKNRTQMLRDKISRIENAPTPQPLPKKKSKTKKGNKQPDKKPADKKPADKTEDKKNPPQENGDLATPPPVQTESDMEQRIGELLLLRDRLRLRVLELPLEKRQGLLDAEEKQQRILLEKAQADKAQEEAQIAEREAELARQRALEEAMLAETALAKSLAEEKARMEQMRGILANLRQQISEERQVNARKMQQAFDNLDAFHKNVSEIATDSNQADALYGEIVDALTVNRSELDKALNALLGERRVPVYKPQINLDEPPFLNAGEDKDRLKSSIVELQLEAEKLAVEEKTGIWSHVLELAQDVGSLNSLRLQLLPSLTKKKRKNVLGLTREGFAQFNREISQLKLMSRYYILKSLDKAKGGRDEFFKSISIGSVAWKIFKILFLSIAFLILSRKYKGYFSNLRAHMLARRGDPKLRLIIDRWMRFLEGILSSVGLLLFIYLFFWLVGKPDIKEIQFIRILFLTFAWYRISIAIFLHLILGAISARRVVASAEMKSRIRKSISLSARYIFPMVVFLVLSVQILGKGYLYGLVVKFAWLGAFPLAAILIGWWRPSITRSYLEGFPDGRLADEMRRTQEKSSGIFVAAVAVFFVMSRGIRIAFKDSMSRFKHTRKAVAYLFRKQLEKHAESVGQADENVDDLPDSLKNAFLEKSISAELRIDHFPEMDNVVDQIEKWQQGKTGKTVAVVGESGIGKTTWLEELKLKLNPYPVILADIEEDAWTEIDVCHLLCKILQIPQADNSSDIIRELNNGPSRLVVLDQCQNLVLKAVGGVVGFAAFADIIAHTCKKVFWVCTFSKYIWEYVEKAYFGRSVFSDIILLKPWDEKLIGDMIAMRMKSSGYQASYDDLIIDRVDGTEFEHEVIRTGERYLQLLWDYSDGIPRVALHFWLRSLVPFSEGIMKVRLFSAPSADALENLSDQSRFVLTAMLIHQNLTLGEAERVLNYPLHVCELVLLNLTNKGLAVKKGDRYQITSHWHRAIVRYLKRKHLLYS